MKLTKKQAEEAFKSWSSLSSRMDLSTWLETYDFPDPPQESMWIWGGDRLPTEEDADTDNTVHIFNPITNRVGWTSISSSILKERFWTPAPKHLKKPEPPDPFEAWYRGDWNENGDLKDHMRQAFLAGQQSQNK